MSIFTSEQNGHTHFRASVLILIILFSLLFAANPSFAQQSTGDSTNNIWYIGKGVTAGTYLKYQIVQTYLNNTSRNASSVQIDNFNMTLTFKSFDVSSSVWTVMFDFESLTRQPTHHVYETSYLSDRTMSTIDNEYYSGFNGDHISLYDHSIGAASAWFLRPGRNLSDGQSQSQGCEPYCYLTFKTIGQSTATTPAGTFGNTTELLLQSPYYSSSYNITIYVDRNLPYPVVGSATSNSCASMATGNQSHSVCGQIISHYRLLAYGHEKLHTDVKPIMKTVSMSWEDDVYEISYLLGTRTIAKTDSNYTGLFLTFDDSSATGGIMMLNLPVPLVKSAFGYSDYAPIESLVSVDEDGFYMDAHVHKSSTCSSVMLAIPVFEGARGIAMYIPRMEGSSENSGDSIKPSGSVMVTPSLDVDGNVYRLRVVTNASDCSFSLDTGTKTLHISVLNANASENGFMKVTLPHKLLGGNYTVLEDGKPAKHYNYTTSQGGDASTIEAKYSPNATSLDIVGTSVIPEFPFMQASIEALAVAFGVIVGFGRKSHS